MDDPFIGSVLGDYEIQGRIGAGGMGVVYHARQVSLDRHVAVKVLPAELGDDAEYVARFLREARTAASLNHPNIIQVIDAGVAKNDCYFIVMEYVDGMDLAHIVALRGPLSEAVALQYIHQAALGLGHAHRMGVIHRDIKPDNLIISRQGTLKIGDLGLAKWQRKETGLNLTSAETVMGTPYFVPPEQIRHAHDVDGRADMYSLGFTLFFLLTGTPPFTGQNATEILARHLAEAIPDIRNLRNDISPRTGQMIQIMSEKDPSQRFQTMEELAGEVREILRSQYSIHVANAVPRPDTQKHGETPSLMKRILKIGVFGVAAVAIGLMLALVVILGQKVLTPRPSPGSPLPPVVSQEKPSTPVQTAAVPLPEPVVTETVSRPAAPVVQKPGPSPEPPVEEKRPDLPMVKPVVPEITQIEKPSAPPVEPEPRPVVPAAPAEVPRKPRDIPIHGPSMFREWVIISRPEQWSRFCQPSSGTFYLTAAHTGSVEARALLRINFMGQDTATWRKLLAKLPFCTRAILELTPSDLSPDARDLEIEVHRLLRPWGLKPERLPEGRGEIIMYCGEMEKETGWKMASASGKSGAWWREGASGRGFDWDNNALADAENPRQTSFRIASLDCIRLNVLPEFQQMNAEQQQGGKTPFHYGWIIQVARGTGVVRFSSSSGDPSRVPRLLLTLDEKGPAKPSLAR